MLTVFLTPDTNSLYGISPAVAVLAGFVSFISPCVLPLVPAYIAYLGARAVQPGGLSGGPGPGAVAVASSSPSLPVVAAGLGFVAGLSLVFIALFYALTIVVQPVRTYIPIVAGVLVIVMALQIAGVIRIPFLWSEYRLTGRAPRRGGVTGGFLLGVGFASGWTPCIGVTLGAVLSSAVTIGTTAQGLGLMVAYCLGLGLPFVALAFAVERARPLIGVINRHRRAIDLVSAAVLLAMGLLLLTNRLTLLSSGLAQLFPWWPSPTI